MPKRKRKLTPYNRFIKNNMKEAMRTEGSASAAMKKLGQEWQELKNR